MKTHKELMRLVVDHDLTGEDLPILTELVNFSDGIVFSLPGDPEFCRPAELVYAEKHLCHLGQKIQAIKSVKERYDLGLVEAKNLVDAYVASGEYAAEEKRITDNKAYYGR